MPSKGFRERLQSVFFLLALPVLPFLLKLSLGRFFGAVAPAQESVSIASESANNTLRTQSNLSKATEYRVELLMALDLLVRAERTIQAESGSYTQSLGRVPDVLGSLDRYYRIDVMRANRKKLLVVAAGEGHKSSTLNTSILVGDRVSVDERFWVRSNFPIPEPPREYLITVARTVMNRIFSNQFQIPERETLDLWEGVFRRYFKYEIRTVSRPANDPAVADGRTLVAVGVRGPVEGAVVDMQPGADLFEWVYNHRNAAWAKQELSATLEKIYLAERIHQEHTGTYAATFRTLIPSWLGLAELGSEASSKELQEFQLDPTFGFHAEVATRSSKENKAWSVNGYGQIAEISSMVTLVNQWEQARRRVATHGDLPESKAENAGEEALAPIPKKYLKRENQRDKPLLIDAVPERAE